MALLRGHLLIGPPASGKTTLAGVLAGLTGAVVLSTDVVRDDLFGDAAPPRDNVRHGDPLGTALLSAPRLREIHGVVSQAPGRLVDPTTQDLLRELEQRLAWGGIAVDGAPLVRPDSLAAERQAEALETAIVERRRPDPQRTAGSLGPAAPGAPAAPQRRHLLRPRSSGPAAAGQPPSPPSRQTAGDAALLQPGLGLRLPPRGPAALPDRAHPLLQAPARRARVAPPSGAPPARAR